MAQHADTHGGSAHACLKSAKLARKAVCHCRFGRIADAAFGMAACLGMYGVCKTRGRELRGVGVLAQATRPPAP